MSGPLREELMSDKHRIRLETWPRVICLLPPPPPPHGFSIRECRQEPSGGWSGDATSLETFVHIVSEFDICEDGDRSNIRPHRPGGAGAKSRTRRREPAELGSLFCFYHLKETKFWDPISCNNLRLEFPETDSDRYRQFSRSSFQRTVRGCSSFSGPAEVFQLICIRVFPVQAPRGPVVLETL